MTTFVITFGVQYEYDEHPVLGLKPELPDGWATIERETELQAREWLRDNLDSAYAFIHTEEMWRREGNPALYYPAGHHGDIEEILEEVEREFLNQQAIHYANTSHPNEDREGGMGCGQPSQYHRDVPLRLQKNRGE